MSLIKVEKGLFSRYSSLTKAIQSANEGDQIIVQPGVYKEAVVLTKSIEICAAADGVIVESQDDNVVRVTGGNSAIRGLTLRQLGGADKCAVVVEAGRSLFENCRMQSQSSDGIFLVNADTNPVFKNCTIAGSREGGVIVANRAQGSFENCRIFDNGASNVIISDAANPLFINCELFDSRQNGVWVRDGGGGKFQGCNIYANTYPNVGLVRQGNSLFENCQIHDGQGVCVYVYDGGLGRFLSCDIYKSGNQCTNVQVEAEGNPTFEQCTIRDSSGNGVWCSDKGAGRFVACEITRSVGPNINILVGSNPIFEKCRIHSGQKSGVWIREGGLGKFSGCDIYENASSNAAVSLSGNPKFELCNFYRSQKDGIWVIEDGEGEFINCRSFENLGKNIRVESSATVVKNCSETEPPSIDKILEELDALIGLEGVKKQIRKTIQFIEFNKEVSQYGVNAQDIKMAASHTVLSGNPGTGKTTVARLLGKLYAAMGLLPSGHVVAVNREKLVAQYIGQTAPKTKEWIEQASGGILFIDEAYELSNKGAKDFGPEAIAVILEEMENRRGEFIVVIAGYSDEIKQFLETNPGLKSRFNQEFSLEDYSPEEMRQIAVKLYQEKERTITPDGLQLLFQEFTDQWRKRDRFFANARSVRNLVELSLQQQAERCMSASREQWNQTFLTTVTHEDIQAVLPKKAVNPYVLPIQEKALEEALASLDQLIGLSRVKSEIHKLVTLVRYYREEGKDIASLSPHTILRGSPGTGKTEVARIIAGIYAALGILERGDLIEVNRDKLVSAYPGESEKITAQFIEKSMGGVLFIDEAYQLTQYGPSDPGHKVVEVLLKYMEDRRGEFIVIAAGYSAQMEQFLASNDGLRRRFVRQLEFEDYTPDELMQISSNLIAKSGYSLEEKAYQALGIYFLHAYQNRDHSFGNAGFARNVITETIKNMDYRAALVPKENRTQEFNRTILLEDLAVSPISS
jgi:F-box protein 11